MNCPHCNCALDRHETLEGETNYKNGEISFCIFCGEIGMFHNNTIVVCDREQLSDDEKNQINEIEHAWLKSKNLGKVMG